MSTTQSNRLRVGIVLCVVLLTIAIVLTKPWRESETWTVVAEVGGHEVEATITWTSDRAILWMGHQPLLGGGRWEYTAVLKFSDGRRFIVSTDAQPRAIWELHGKIYLACRDAARDWRILRLDDCATVGVLRKDLPDGPRPWNLEPPTKESQAEWESNFQMWAR